MGSLSIWHWIIVIGVVLLLFGRGKISELMGDVATGIKAFKKGMQDDDTTANVPPKAEPPYKAVEHQSTTAPGLAGRAETEKRVEGTTL
jgi:sec-independent protein translocase protein TatA